MTHLPKASLISLLAFIPNNYNERNIFDNLNKEVLTSYFNDTKNKYFNGTFYLGGQIIMNPDEEITLDKIKEVRDIDRKRYIEYGGPCNSLEAMSIYIHNKYLNEMEEIIKAYTKIMCMRELDKTKLSNDVNNIIVSFTI